MMFCAKRDDRTQAGRESRGKSTRSHRFPKRRRPQIVTDSRGQHLKRRNQIDPPTCTSPDPTRAQVAVRTCRDAEALRRPSLRPSKTGTRPKPEAPSPKPEPTTG